MDQYGIYNTCHIQSESIRNAQIALCVRRSSLSGGSFETCVSAEHRGDTHGDSCARATDPRLSLGFGGFFVCSLHEYRIAMDDGGG